MSRVKRLRTSAALIGVTATALLVAVAPASADAAKGKLNGQDTAGLKVKIGKDTLSTSLMGFQVGDKELKTYCVDIDTRTDHTAGYIEADWNKHPKPGSAFKENSKYINWILHNAYPAVSNTDLAGKVGGTFKDGLSVAEAVAATQAAIWHFSDKKELTIDDATPEAPDSKADVVAVYKFLIDTEKNNKGIDTQPKPVLTLEPDKLTGKAGSLIGPFVVTTSASGVTIAATLPEGVIFSDKDGKELPKADVAAKIQQLDKYEFFVKVPESITTGKVEFSVSGDTQFALGRLFIGERKKTQSLIVATSQTVKLEAKGLAEWGVQTTTTTTSDTPAAQPKNNGNELANTGASVLMPIVIGVVLVGGGVGALIFTRRRRRV